MGDAWRAGRGEALRGGDPAPLTVVVPVYNGEATLQRTLDSLVAQTFAGWRAVVVDDGSADGSREVAEAAAARDARLSVISQANAGVSAARNRGVAATDSPWLLFLDGDDTLAPGGLAALAAGARAGVDVVVGHVPMVDDEGKVWIDFRQDISRAWDSLSVQCAFPIHAALVRRDMVTAIGGFDETLAGNEDWDLWVRIARCGAVFRQVPELAGYYWTRPGTASKSYRPMAESALVVARRAHGPDPRTPQAAPAYAAGLPADQFDRHAFPAVLWSATGEVALGGEAAWLDEIDRPQVAELTEADVRNFADAMKGAVVTATRTPLDALAPLWPGLSGPLAGLLDRLFPGPARAVARGQMLMVLKDKFGVPFDPAAAEAPSVLQLALDLGAPVPIARPTPGQGLAVQVREDGRSLGVALAWPSADGGAPDTRTVVLDGVAGFSMHSVSEALRPWRSPAFLVALAREALTGLRGGKRAAFTRAVTSLIRARL